MTDDYHVIGCPNCQRIRVSEGYATQETVTCPVCETTTKSRRIKSFISAESEETARDYRGQILANKSDHDVDNDKVGYVAAQERADTQLAKREKWFKESVEQSIEEYREQFDHPAKDVLGNSEEWFAEDAERVLETGISGADDRYDDAVETKFGNDRAHAYCPGDATAETQGSIVYTGDGHVNPDTRLRLDGSPRSLWQQCFEEGNRDAMVEAFEAAADELDVGRHGTGLFQDGVTAVDGYVASAFANATTGGEGIESFVATVERLGETLADDLRTSIDDIITGPIALLALIEETPTVEVRLSDAFWNSEYSQRARTCAIITALADVADVRVLTTFLERRRLAKHHREDLLDISEAAKAHRRTCDAVAQAEAAVDALGTDGTKVEIVRQLCDEPGGNLSYHEVSAAFDLSAARRSQLVSSDDDSLTDLGLVEAYHSGQTKRLEVTQTGKQFTELVEGEIANQRQLDDYFSEVGNPSDNTRVNTAVHEGSHTAPQPGEDGEQQLYEVRWMARYHHAAVATSGTDGGMRLVDRKIDRVECAAEPEVSYNPANDEVVVSVEAQTLPQTAVCLSRALAGQKVRERVLTDDRLDAVDVPETILRDCRGIGGLSSEAENDPAVLRENIADWCERLCQLSAFTTAEARDENHERWENARRDILRGAHGLISTVVHLFDLLGVTLHREIRLPEYASDYDGKAREGAIAKFLGIQASIQSNLGHFASYKQHYESREEKRTSFKPDVDPTDPYGDLIGSFVIIGPGIENFASTLRTHLDNPAELYDDAPEFEVPIPITGPGMDRSHAVSAANRVLDTKNLTSTSAAVDVLRTVLETPYDITTALNALSPEDKRRAIRPDEIRYALASIRTGRLFPDETTTISKVAGALLTATRPLPKGDLADEANVSEKSIYNNLETLEALEALDIIRETDDGYRIALSFHTDDGRDEWVLPEYANTDAPLQDVVWSVATTLVADASRFGDDDDPVGRYFVDPHPSTLADLHDSDPAIARWLGYAVTLTGNDSALEPDTPESVARMGPRISHDQTSIQEATA